jgi:hypothetical protein
MILQYMYPIKCNNFTHYDIKIVSDKSYNPTGQVIVENRTLFIYFSELVYFIHSTFYPPPPIPPFDCSTSYMSSPPSVSMWMSSTPHPTWPLNSPGSPVSWALGVSSLNEHRPSRPLLYMCWGPHISWCMLSAWCSTVGEISGVEIETAGPPTGLLFSSASFSLP